MVEEKIKCAHCDMLFDEDEITTVQNGDQVCDDCLDDKYTLCEHCDEQVLKDDTRHVHNIGYVCESCIEDNYTCCYDCGEYIHNDDSTYIEFLGDYVCENCRDENYFICENCGSIYHNDDSHRDGDYNYCEDCYEEGDREDNYSGSEAQCLNYVSGNKETIKNIPPQNIGKLSLDIEESLDCFYDNGRRETGILNVRDPIEGSYKFNVEEQKTYYYLGALANVINGLEWYIEKDKDFKKLMDTTKYSMLTRGDRCVRDPISLKQIKLGKLLLMRLKLCKKIVAKIVDGEPHLDIRYVALVDQLNYYIRSMPEDKIASNVETSIGKDVTVEVKYSNNPNFKITAYTHDVNDRIGSCQVPNNQDDYARGFYDWVLNGCNVGVHIYVEGNIVGRCLFRYMRDKQMKEYLVVERCYTTGNLGNYTGQVLAGILEGINKKYNILFTNYSRHSDSNFGILNNTYNCNNLKNYCISSDDKTIRFRQPPRKIIFDGTTSFYYRECGTKDFEHPTLPDTYYSYLSTSHKNVYKFMKGEFTLDNINK